MRKISDKEIKKLIISAQYLAGENVTGFTELSETFRNLGYVQLDTIHVTERAHHHILWSRNPSYDQQMLTDLMAENKVFEYWSHAASILQIESFKYTLRRKQNFAWHNEVTDSADFQTLLTHVYERICQEGALSSSDFDDKHRKPREIWSWKLSRYALEYLFQQGKLMVARRDKFRKVYDLTERVYPESREIVSPSPDEIAAYQINQAISAHGALTEKEIRDYLKFADAASISKVIKEYVTKGSIKPVEYNNKVYYTSAQTPQFEDYPEKVCILSPFDNFIINRRRILDIFNFDYKLECYLPAAKRKFGFFSMPLLYQDRFIGLLDAKAERKKKVLQINNLIKFTKLSNREEKLLQSAIEDFAAFNNCQTIDLNPHS